MMQNNNTTKRPTMVRQQPRRQYRISITTLGALLFATLFSVMFAALLYLSWHFPMDSSDLQQQQDQQQSTNHHHHHQSSHHTPVLIDPSKNSKQPKKFHLPTNEAFGIHDASADGGLAALVDNNEMLFPQKESKHPPRVYTCRCYPQVKYAFSQKGFTMKANATDYNHSWIIWKTGTDIDMKALQHWQRPNHFPGERTMDRKGAMFQIIQQWSQRNNNAPIDFLPETYVLYDERDRQRFLQRLSSNYGNVSGMDQPWVLKHTRASRGRGVFMLGPHSPELEELRDDLAAGDKKNSKIAQSYIQNEWTYQGHKCDLRVYVLVASVEPLIVYYHDGIVRTATGLYDKDNFEESKAHLTNVSQNKKNRTLWEPVKTFGQLDTELRSYILQDNVAIDTDDPLRLVRNQIKKILGVVFAAFRSRINLNDEPVDNAFSLMGADFVIDQDLKVWLLEMQLGPQLVGDNHPEKIALLQDVLTTSIDVVEEVYHKQARKEPLLPLEKTGKFELVYYDDSYKFEPLEE